MDQNFWLLNVRILIFDLIIAFALAKLEIQIEGKHGWAENLPTWRIKNKFTKLIWGEQPYTGYHFWIFTCIFLLLHFPFVLNPNLWNPSIELLIIAHSFIGIIIEDFLWFVLNPFYGFRKFDYTHAPWHKHWKFKLPTLYFKLTAVIIVFTGLAFIIQ